MNRLRGALQGWLDLDRLADDIGDAWAASLQRVSPVRTGALKAGWSHKVTGNDEVKIITAQNIQYYGQYVMTDEINESALNDSAPQSIIDKHLRGGLT